MKKQFARGITAFVVAGTVVCGAAPASAKTTDFIDLSAGLGYSSNPFLTLNNNSSAFGRISAFGEHAWESETGKTSLSAYLENTTYFNSYGSKPLFDLNARTQQAVSPNVSLFGTLEFSGDFAGQLSNRLFSVPSEPPPVSGNPLPPPTNTPDLIGLSGRQYRVLGEAGASIRAGPRGTFSLTAGAERLIFTGNNNPAPDYNIFFGSVGYQHQVSERTSVGGTVYLQRQDFSASNYSNVVNPVLTFQSHLSESLTLDGGIGVLVIDRHRNGASETTTTPSFRLGLCSSTSVSSFCGRISRDAQSALGTGIPNSTGQAAVTTEGDLTYYRRLGQDDTIQASMSAVHYDTSDPLLARNFHTTYIEAIVGYDHKFSRRFSAGVHLGARQLYQPGPNPDADLNGNLYLRYRIGQLL